MTTPTFDDSPRDWFFTFGADHTHPDTGQRLGRNYVRIHGTCDGTRDEMFAAFGNRWSHQYSTRDKARCIDEYGLTEVPMPEVAVSADPVRPDCAGLPMPVGDSVPACGLRAAHYPHIIGESVTFRRDTDSAQTAEVGVDVQADLDILRGLLTAYLRDDALGVHARQVGFEALQRIEQWAGKR